MKEPELRRGTTASVQLVPTFGRDGALVCVVIVKERFAVDTRQRVERAGDAEVHLADVPWDEDAPETSTIRYPADVCEYKPGTDVIIAGHAVPPPGARVAQLDVLARVGPIDKVLRVFGPRVWYRGALGLSLTPPEPLTAPVPLRWEYAFGGADFSDPKRPVEEPRNPSGRGVVRDPATLVHTPGPQIEDPREPITGHRARPAPAGVGAIGRHWVPRRGYAGTIDELWQRERMPLPPLDFDPRFDQAAPPDQIVPGFLRGGERVHLANMSAEGPLDFPLPRLQFFVGARIDDGLVEHRVALDTVVLEPGQRAVHMTWRACVPLPRRAAALHYVQVHEKAVV